MSNTVPVGFADGEVLGHLWLMFASHTHFRTLTTNRLTPVFDYNASALSRPDLKLTGEWELAGGAIPLPRKVVYYNPGGFYARNASNELAFRRYGGPYAEGFTNAAYVATGEGKIGDCSIPMGFVFEWYVPGGARRSNRDLAIRQRAVAVVNYVAPVCSRTSLLPSARAPTTVLDLRFGGSWTSPVPAAAYLDTKGNRWAAVDESRRLYGQMTRPRGASPVLLGALTLLLLAPVPVYLVARLRRGRDH